MIMYDRNGRELKPGDIVAYCPGYKCEIGCVKSGRSDGKIFVRYSNGDTAALTDSAMLYRIENYPVFDKPITTDVSLARLLAWYFGVSRNTALNLVLLCKEYLLELHNNKHYNVQYEQEDMQC